MNYCLVDADGIVQNIIIYDGVAHYKPPAGMTLVQSDAAGLGWTYTNGVFTNPK